MKVVSTETVQAECLEIIDEIEATGASFLICKDNVPYAKLVPFEAKTASAARTKSRRKRRAPRSGRK
jgi:antitoxin (DNA-binding transcriptional repressor) of toxin-antitoxin stability system